MIALIRLAWRNVWRNRRRSLITMAAILFSVLIITLTRSLQYGTYDAMESQAVRQFTGEVQLQHPDYRDDPTFENAISEADSVWGAALEAVPAVERSTRRVTGYGLVSADSGSAGSMIVGVDPVRERAVSTFTGRVVRGNPLDAEPGHAALVGRTLAQNLGAGVGDSLIVLTQGYRNELGADVYRIAGLLRTASVEMDRSLVVLHLEDAQALFAMQGRLTQVVLVTDDFRKADRVAARLQERLPEGRIAAYDWETLMPELRQVIILDNASGAIFLVFMLILVGFEIFNSTTMSVVERTREFGVLQAVGMKPSRISTIVLAELLIKIALALLVSIGAAAMLLTYLEGHPIPLTEEMRAMYEEFGFSVDALLFSTRRAVFLEPLISIAAIALLATLYPVMRVLRLEPVEALRYAT